MSLKGIVQGTVNRVKDSVGVLNENTKAEGVRRYSICVKCFHTDNSPMLVNGRCSKEKGGCGCFMETKVLVPQEKCPKNKW